MSPQVGWGTTLGMDPEFLEALGWKEYIELASQPYPAHALARLRGHSADDDDCQCPKDCPVGETRMLTKVDENRVTA